MALNIKLPRPGKFLKFPKMKFDHIDEIITDTEGEADGGKVVYEQDPKAYPGRRYQTIKDAFRYARANYMDNPMILQKPDHKTPYRTYTYREFTDDVIDFGTGLTKVLGMQDERFIIFSETTYGWYLSYMTMLCGAGLAVPLDKELPVNEIENLINRSHATAVIYSDKKKKNIEKLKDQLPQIKWFIKMDSDAEPDGRDIGLNYIKNEGHKLVAEGDHSFLDIEVEPDAFKVLFFTSGTTSTAKGVMVSSRNLAENINAAAVYVNLQPWDCLFSVLPLHHAYESSIGFLYPFGLGASVAVCEGLRYILPNVQEAKPTSIIAVPILLENIYKNIQKSIKKSKKTQLVNTMIHVTNALGRTNVDMKHKVFKSIYDNLGGRLRILVSAAAPIDPEVGKWFAGIGILFMQGYGLTETAPIAALTPDYDLHVGSAGKAVYCAKLKIQDPNENGEGEVLIHSRTLMLGYYEDEEATREAIDPEGWFHSGDIGYLDDEGFLYITGRIKNVSVTQNGKNIYPEEIETLLKNHSEIAECMVYGKEVEDSKKLIITARIKPNIAEIEALHGLEKPDEEKVADILWEICKDVNKQMVGYKAITALEVKRNDFALTTTMKIKRYQELQDTDVLVRGQEK